MNKQDLIEKLEKEKENKLGGNFNLAINTAIMFAQQLDDPQEVLDLKFQAECKSKRIDELIDKNKRLEKALGLARERLANERMMLTCCPMDFADSYAQRAYELWLLEAAAESEKNGCDNDNI